MANLTTITAKPAPEQTQSCWSCGTMRAVHFCESCGKVQPPVPVNYFAFFGLPLKLNVDVAALEKDFYELSRKLHPDLNARAGSHEQEWSLEQSSLLNDAYRTLKEPIKRTQYLLSLEGIELEEQSKSATEQARASGEAKKQIDREQTGEAISPDARKQARDKMVDVLNRRNYIRNLVRDVSEALEN